TRLERHLSVGEFSDANLRPLQIRHDADLARQRTPDLAHEPRTLEMIFGCSMRKIEPDDVDAGGDHSMQNARIAARGTERRDNLGGAGQSALLSGRVGNGTVNSAAAVRRGAQQLESRPLPRTRDCGSAEITISGESA